jgi:hypothetical protein
MSNINAKYTCKIHITTIKYIHVKESIPSPLEPKESIPLPNNNVESNVLLTKIGHLYLAPRIIKKVKSKEENFQTIISSWCSPWSQLLHEFFVSKI